MMRARHPIVPKLTLLDAITQPVGMHVHGFRLSRGNGILDDAQRCHVILLDRRRGLRVAHLDQSMPGGDGIAEIDEESAKLGLGGGGHDGFDYLRYGEDGAVVLHVGGIV